jgi:5-formyltetrahydrofolate cyclo-ligase
MTKEQARTHGRSIRLKLSSSERAHSNQAITQHCQQRLDWERYRRVHVFLPIAKQHEIDTWPLVRWVWEWHPEIRLLVPRLHRGRMEQVVITPGSRFEPSELGIPEPLDGEVLEAGGRVELALVPLLAFDEHGNRVGYGSGFYDRFLCQQPEARRVGLAYEACQAPRNIAADDHDVRLDAVITEAGLREFDK